MLPYLPRGRALILASVAFGPRSANEHIELIPGAELSGPRGVEDMEPLSDPQK